MIIVTGGAGFIGSQAVIELNRTGKKDIIIVDKLRSGPKWKNLVSLDYFDYIDKEIFRADFLSGKLDKWKPEAVIHLGACSCTTETDADYLMDNNFHYSKDLATWSLSRGSRFIYASSGATYGNGNEGFMDNETELCNLSPLNIYGYTKHLFDLWMQKNGLLSKSVGLKFFNVYGPNEAHKGPMRSVIHKAFGQMIETGSIKLFRSRKSAYADGEQKRDFVYVKDVTKLVVDLISKTTINGIYNVGQGVSRSFNDLAVSVCKAMNEKQKIEYIDMPDNLLSTYQYFTEAPIEKISKACPNWTVTRLEDGVEDYVVNYLLPQLGTDL